MLLAWLPDHLFYGKPRLIDAICIPASEVAKSRDDHYHNPPDYLVLSQKTPPTGLEIFSSPALIATSFKEAVKSWLEQKASLRQREAQSTTILSTCVTKKKCKSYSISTDTALILTSPR